MDATSDSGGVGGSGSYDPFCNLLWIWAEVVHHDLLALTDLVDDDASAPDMSADTDHNAVDQDQTKLYRKEIGTIWFARVVWL